MTDYRHCFLCPRKCGAHRTAGNIGFCGQSDQLLISSIAPHFGEEPPISGFKGSGTVFFSGCSTGCFFCQNHQISRDGIGSPYSFHLFCEKVELLAKQGVHNINYVTPDHFWPHIRELIKWMKSRNIVVPNLINSSGYERIEIIKEMAEYVDIFLPDFKFADNNLASYCMGKRDYKEVALSAIEIMIDAKGFLDSSFDDKEIKPASRGVLVRHLVLPGAVQNSIDALKLLRERFGKYLPISLMNQYYPTIYCKGMSAFERPVSSDEYHKVLDAALDLGFENMFCQSDDSDNEFFPDFNKETPFKGNVRT